METKKPGMGFIYGLSMALLLVVVIGFAIVSQSKKEDTTRSEAARVTTLTTQQLFALDENVAPQTPVTEPQALPPVSSETTTTVSAPAPVKAAPAPVPVQELAANTLPATPAIATSTTQPPVKVQMRDGDFKLFTGEQGQVIIEGAIENCAAIDDLVFYYRIELQETAVAFDCSLGVASIYEPINGVNLSERIKVDVGIRSVSEPDIDSSLRLEVDSNYSNPFPAIPANSGEGRRIIYDNPNQRVWMVGENNFVYDSYLVSGKKDTPKPGTYSVFSKSERAYSSAPDACKGLPASEWPTCAAKETIYMSHMVRFVRPDPSIEGDLAIGFHGIPVDPTKKGAPLQTEAELGKFLSAGCVRQNDHTAKKLFDWAEVGTTVVVL